MKAVLIPVALLLAVIAVPPLTDLLVERAMPQGSNFTAAEQAAHNELVVRAGKEADARKKKLSLSEQAMIVRDLYGN